MHSFRYLTAILALGAGLASLPAHAQWNNQPYQLPSRNNGFGMSPAYKQVILERKLFGTPTNPILRDSSGNLINFERRGNLIFPRAQASPFLLSESRTGISFDGVSLAWGLGYPNYTYSSGGAISNAGAVISSWTGMLDGAPPAGGGYGYGGSGAVIDAWISQLASIPSNG